MSETRILTAAQMSWADKATIQSGISGFRLMDRAGRAVATTVLEQMPDYGRVVIITGCGNNAGDGFAAAHYLKQHRIPVTIVSLCPIAELRGDSRAHADRAGESGAKIREACAEHCIEELNRWLARAVMLVDAMLGIGLNRPLNGLMLQVVERINQSDRPVLSIDIASGLCADTGAVLGAAVQADVTLPISVSKWGHWLAEGRDYTGKLLPAAHIGIDDASIRAAWRASCESVPFPVSEGNAAFCVHSTCLISDDFLTRAWPARRRLSHKGDYGHVWIFGGSSGFTGAPQLAGLGAYAAGAGLVSVACPDELWPLLAGANLEMMVHPQSLADWQAADTLVIGPGWGVQQGDVLSAMLEADKPVVVDADGLNIVAESQPLQHKLAGRTQLTVITPHPGEAARLLGVSVDDIQRDRKQSVLELSSRYACWVVLKGSETLIASPEKDIYLNPFGSPQLAVAGSGDVLAGMIGAQLARLTDQDTDLGVLISAAVALHGKAGERSGWHLAGELTKVVADVRQRIEQGEKV